MATVSSTSPWHFLDCQLKKSRPVCLMVHKFDSSSKMNISQRLCQILRRMLGYHSKTSSRTFLEIHVQVITQKLFRSYWRATKHLVATCILNYIFALPSCQLLEDLGAVSDEQGERFHQDLKIMEERYQGRWDVHMMADYCWSIKRDSPQVEHSRKSYKRKFLP